MKPSGEFEQWSKTVGYILIVITRGVRKGENIRVEKAATKKKLFFCRFASIFAIDDFYPDLTTYLANTNLPRYYNVFLPPPLMATSLGP